MASPVRLRTGNPGSSSTHSMRKVFFWLHLLAGIVAGIVIAIMSFTGAVLAFETELVAWAERDARRVAVPAEGEVARLALTELRRRAGEQVPELRSAAVTVSRDPADAVAFAAGRDNVYYADPYTGELRKPRSTAVHDFMHVMVDWHRFLGRGGDSRPMGKAITGACNLAFLFLAVSGLYLWWPRSWSWRGFKAIAWLNLGTRGRARDFNWHNAVGLWTAPVLVVLTLTAVPISYRWGTSLIYRAVGESPPAQGGPVAAAPQGEMAPVAPGTAPASLEAILARAQGEHPRWTQITVRSGTGRPARGAQPAAAGNGQATGRAAGVQPLTLTIRESGTWPRTATTSVAVHPYSAEVLRREGFADLSTGRQIRSWTRFLHTGQALGWGGQLVAGLASLAALVLVYTGFALSWRRFFPSRAAAAAPAKDAAVSARL